MAQGPGAGRWIGLALLGALFVALLRLGPPEGSGLPGAAGPGVRPTALPEARPSPETPRRGRLAVVLDDWGYPGAPVALLEGLGLSVTAAVLPIQPGARKAAEAAAKAGHEVILHCPMKAKGKGHPEQGMLFPGMGAGELRSVLAAQWALVPGAKGLNNHEGSLACEDRGLMGLVAGFLKGKGAYFLDSVTSPRSAIPSAARAAGVPLLKRRVFLDNEKDPAAIEARLREAAAIALKEGACVAIGHARPATLNVLQRLAPGLRGEGLAFVTAGSLAAR